MSFVNFKQIDFFAFYVLYPEQCPDVPENIYKLKSYILN